MNEFEQIKDIFENAILMDFQKFSKLLQDSANRRDIIGCCHDILILRLKMKRHFKKLADQLEFPHTYSEEDYKQLHAIYEMAYTLLNVPTGYEQTTITDELKRIVGFFEDSEWHVDESRVLLDFNDPALQ